MFLDLVDQFGENLGEQAKGRSQKKPKSLVEVPSVAHLKVQVANFNTNLVFSPYHVPRQVMFFGEKLRDQVKVLSQNKLKSSIDVPYLAHMKVQVLSFNMNLFSSP